MAVAENAVMHGSAREGRRDVREVLLPDILNAGHRSYVSRAPCVIQCAHLSCEERPGLECVGDSYGSVCMSVTRGSGMGVVLFM